MDEAVLNVDNVEDNLDNYILYKNDRKSGPHGGVLLYIQYIVHCFLHLVLH